MKTSGIISAWRKILRGERPSLSITAGNRFKAVLRGEQKANMLSYLAMDEGRKRVLGIMAAILASRKLAMSEIKKNPPAYVYAISEAVSNAAEIMQRIDREWPTKVSKSA